MKMLWLYIALPVVLLLLFSSPNSDANDDNVHFSWTLKTNTGSDEESLQQGSFQCTQSDLSDNHQISESDNFCDCCECQPNYYKPCTSVLNIRFNGAPPATATASATASASATNARDPLLGIWMLSGGSERTQLSARITYGLASESCCINIIDDDCCFDVCCNANEYFSHEVWSEMSSYGGDSIENVGCFLASLCFNPVIGWTLCCPCTLSCCICYSTGSGYCSEESASRRNDIDQSTPSECVEDTRVNHVSVTDSITATAVTYHSSTPSTPQVINIFRNSLGTRSWLTQIIQGSRTGTETIIIPGFLHSPVDIVDTFVNHLEGGNVLLEMHVQDRSLPLSRIDITLSTLSHISIDRISFYGSDTEFTVIRQPAPVVTTQPITNNTLPTSSTINQAASPQAQDQQAPVSLPPPHSFIFPHSHTK